MKHTFPVDLADLWRNAVYVKHSRRPLLEHAKWVRWKSKSRIIVAAAGPSLHLIQKMDLNNVLLVADQSSAGWLVKHGFNPDIVVVTDPGPAAWEKVKKAGLKQSTKIVAGAYTATACEAKTWIVPLNFYPRSDELIEFDDRIAEMYDGKMSVTQFGNVTNTTLAILGMAMHTKVLPRVPITLVGLDLSLGRVGGRLYTHIDEPAQVIGGGFGIVDDELVTPQFKIYEEQFAWLVKNIGLDITLFNPGSRLLKYVGAYDDQRKS